MVDEQDLICVIIKIGVDNFFVPIEAICVEIICKSSTIDSVLSTSFRILVSRPIRTPMKSRTESFRSSSICLWIPYVSTTFHDVYFSTGRPSSIFKEPRHHPDCWPKPIALRQFSSYFNPSIGECKGLNSSHFSTHDRREVIDSIGFPFAAIIERSCAKISGRATPLFIITVISHIIGAYLILKQNWLDVQNGVISVGRSAVVIIDLKLMVTSAGHGEVMPPFSIVQLVEIIVEDKLRRAQYQQEQCKFQLKH